MTDDRNHDGPVIRVRVWDIGVRLFHWLLVASVIATYVLSEQRALHRRLGYIVLALIAFRLVWGLIGSSAITMSARKR